LDNIIKIAFISLGCDKNLIDAEIMLGLIDEQGYTITSNESEADIVIINSCGFIADANEETIENILRIADYKETGKCKGIIVTGCMAERYKQEIFKSLPEVDAVVGTGDFEKIVFVINEILEGKKNVKLITDKNHIINDKNYSKRIVTTAGGFAYLKIAEGCNNFCTYCTIPYLRGKYRSRTIDSIIEESKILAYKGVKEIIIVAQDTSLYGTDLYGEKKLPELINKISEIDGIEWIRILYCYPEHINDELIKTIAENKKVCHYIDMPIQHINNRILKTMGRRSSKENIEKIISKLREYVDDICIRTTLIVGFPGETKEEFNELVDFVKKIKFDRLGVFTYSREEGTPAYNMDNQIDENLKEDRKNYIMETQKNISASKCATFKGKILKVIVEGKIENEDNVYCGRSYRDCYEIDGFVFFKSDEDLIAGDFVNVKITDASDYDLMGDVTGELAK